MSLALRNMLRTYWSPLARRAARAYVAGPGLADALRTCCRLSRDGIASTVCYWDGEGDRPRHIADAYLAALDAVAREGLNCSLSVKAPPLGFARDLFAEIVTRARRDGLIVHFDSLAVEAADETFALITEERTNYSRLGCTLPGRWRRSVRDADLAVDLGLNVRVVKGQWVGAEARDLDPRAGFLAVVDRLAGRASHVGVATHDAALAREALRRLRGARTPCELELLLGLPARPALREARTAGVPVRFYVPYGHAALPYRLAQAPQNPRIVWWIVRDLLRGRSLSSPGSGDAAAVPQPLRCARL